MSLISRERAKGLLRLVPNTVMGKILDNAVKRHEQETKGKKTIEIRIMDKEPQLDGQATAHMHQPDNITEQVAHLLVNSRPTTDNITTAPQRSAPKCHFFSLPRELRDQIYELALPYGEVRRSARSGVASRSVQPYPALLLASKQIHHEASTIYYNQNVFVCINFSIAADFLGNFSIRQVESLKALWLFATWGSREDQRKQVNLLIKQFGRGVLKADAVRIPDESRTVYRLVRKLEDLCVSEDGKGGWCLLWKDRSKGLTATAGPIGETQEEYENRTRKGWKKVWGQSYAPHPTRPFPYVKN